MWFLIIGMIKKSFTFTYICKLVREERAMMDHKILCTKTWRERVKKKHFIISSSKNDERYNTDEFILQFDPLFFLLCFRTPPFQYLSLDRGNKKWREVKIHSPSFFDPATDSEVFVTRHSFTFPLFLTFSSHHSQLPFSLSLLFLFYLLLYSLFASTLHNKRNSH